MDILERLQANIDAVQNGPYVGVKEQRDSWQAAKEEIERLRDENKDLKANCLNHAQIETSLSDQIDELRKQVDAMQWRNDK